LIKIIIFKDEHFTRPCRRLQWEFTKNTIPKRVGPKELAAALFIPKTSFLVCYEFRKSLKKTPDDRQCKKVLKLLDFKKDMWKVRQKWIEILAKEINDNADVDCDENLELDDTRAALKLRDSQSMSQSGSEIKTELEAYHSLGYNFYCRCELLDSFLIQKKNLSRGQNDD